jgi:EH domain-containing protein 1
LLLTTLKECEFLQSISAKLVTSIIDGLKKLYIEKLKPLEVAYHFNDFVSPILTESDFDAKPQVMLLGQYSTGKTTFIKHLLRTSYPGAHIGPEPTTDRFVVVMVGTHSLHFQNIMERSYFSKQFSIQLLFVL